jgi:hypothetical protein
MTPNEVFNSNAVPHGGLYVNVYRDQTNPVLLGVYLMEMSTPTENGVVGDRPDTDGGDNGWWLVNGKAEGPATFQIAAGATPTLKNGDMFATSKFSTAANGTGEKRYFAIISPAHDVGMQYRKQSCTVRQDKFPTSAMTTNIQEL